MAEVQKNPPQDPTVNEKAGKVEGSKDAKDAQKAQEEYEKASSESGEALAKAAEAEKRANAALAESAEKRVKAMVENATEEGDPETKEEPPRRRHKFTEDGQIIGLDGENPVSNENPDPLAIRGTYRL
jgi:hypothetical protein